MRVSRSLLDANTVDFSTRIRCQTCARERGVQTAYRIFAFNVRGAYEGNTEDHMQPNPNPSQAALAAARMVDRGETTIAAAARTHGISREIVRAAQRVLRSGTPDVIAAIDAGYLSIRKADRQRFKAVEAFRSAFERLKDLSVDDRTDVVNAIVAHLRGLGVEVAP
jgi:hypothetical protein